MLYASEVNYLLFVLGVHCLVGLSLYSFFNLIKFLSYFLSSLSSIFTRVQVKKKNYKSFIKLFDDFLIIFLQQNFSVFLLDITKHVSTLKMLKQNILFLFFRQLSLDKKYFVFRSLTTTSLLKLTSKLVFLKKLVLTDLYSIYLAAAIYFLKLQRNDMISDEPDLSSIITHEYPSTRIESYFNTQTKEQFKVRLFDNLLKSSFVFLCLNSYFTSLIVLQLILQILFLLGAIAMFTLGERKLMAAVQRRKGPNTSVPFGIVQPLADGFKLLLKEVIVPKKANMWLFFLAPLITFVLSLWQWAVIPFSLELQYITLSPSILYTLAISSLSVYGMIIAGWSSNSKYAFLGAIRAAAQMISYEISLGFIVLTVILLSGTLNYVSMTLVQRLVWFILPLLPCFFLFCIIMLAETNRTPFDLAEAEAELVAGYNVEYSSIIFAFFFLGEYCNMMLMSSIVVILFFGGWLPLFGTGSGTLFWFILKLLFFCVFFVWVRATLPRYRYDQLMSIGWKIVLPISMAFFILVNGVLISVTDVFFNKQNTLFDNFSFYTYIHLKPTSY
jgi:NADH-quinone oxidoreductase subunit H